MKVLKRNQLVVLVISLMLITAGYLNFTANESNTVPTSEYIAEVGDATLVSSTSIDEKNKSDENIAEATSIEIENTQNEIQKEDETVETIAEDDSYFTSSKLERENMYSQILETYQEIYNNANSTEEQKKEALAEISELNNTRNGIMIAENLISAKGFKKVIIFVNTNSVSVILGEKELSAEQIAQIQNIVSRELDITADIIHISTK